MQLVTFEEKGGKFLLLSALLSKIYVPLGCVSEQTGWQWQLRKQVPDVKLQQTNLIVWNKEHDCCLVRYDVMIMHLTKAIGYQNGY